MAVKHSFILNFFEAPPLDQQCLQVQEVVVHLLLVDSKCVPRVQGAFRLLLGPQLLHEQAHPIEYFSRVLLVLQSLLDVLVLPTRLQMPSLRHC